MLSLFDVMSARNTLNSQSAAYDALSLAPASVGNSSQPAVSSSLNSSVAPAALLESLPVFSPTSLLSGRRRKRRPASAFGPANSKLPGFHFVNEAISGGVPAQPTHASQLAA